MASRSSGRPAAGVYLWLRGLRPAATAASTMWSGVGKSGSPAPKPMTGSPAAFRALALASTARVADSAMAATRWEMRGDGNGLAPRLDGRDNGTDECPDPRDNHPGRPAAPRRPLRLRAVEG